MHANGKQTSERSQDSQFSPFPEAPKPQPLVKAEQYAEKAAAKAALMQQRVDLKVQEMVGVATAVNSAVPLIKTFVGDPNANLQMLADVVTTRGCDIAEDHIEITIETEN